MSRLDVAMFNAILRESAEEMPSDPVSDPISDSRVLPIPAGKLSFGAGVQLKNAVSSEAALQKFYLKLLCKMFALLNAYLCNIFLFCAAF